MTRKHWLPAVLLGSLVSVASADPVVTQGPPWTDGASTLDPGSITVEMLGNGETVNAQIAFTFDPVCVAPFDVAVVAVGDGGTFADLTGPLTNLCSGDTNVFDVSFTGDVFDRIYKVSVIIADSGSELGSVAVGLHAGTAPQVTLGAPVGDGFTKVDPGSIRLDNLAVGQTVALQLAITVDPFCVAPIDFVLGTSGDGGTFADLTGQVTNGCGGDTSEFSITLTGDGQIRTFDIEFNDAKTHATYAVIPVVLSPDPAPEVTLGDPVDGDFTTVDPGSIRVEQLSAGNFVELPVSLTVHPLCIVPIDVILSAPGNGGTFEDLTGLLVNPCGGATSVFDIRLTGDGSQHTFDIEFLDANSLSPLATIPVELFPPVPDADDDGIADTIDNCIRVYNPDQYDSNGDRIGNICDADLVGVDCIVNFPDLQAFESAFFTSPGDAAWNPDADLDNSGGVNFADLVIVETQFFGPPGPSAAGCN